jgi:two-component system LytT family sensor kinase
MRRRLWVTVEFMPGNAQSASSRYAVVTRTQTVLLVCLGFTALGILNFGYRYLDDLARDRTGTFGIRLFEEMTGVYAGLALFPLFLSLIRWARIRRDNWWRTIPLNVLIFLVISACDTTLMGACRSLLAPLFGLGAYDYGNMTFRYPMEFAQHVLLFSVAASTIYFIDSYRDARNRQMASADLEARLAEAQLQNLRLQLQPHFLFNALNAISSVMHEDVSRADTMLAQLSDLLRQTLHLGHAQEIPLKDELALLKLYIAVMEGRFAEDLHVEFEIDPALAEVPVPQLILQPLVENAIRYGRGTHASSLRIGVTASREQSELLLRVKDNGPGIANLEAGTWKKGIGLSNTEQRLASLYGEDRRISFENANGLTVTIRVPMKAAAA